ncbi:hypothetical protein BG418_08785 [Streptomyces sp. CBMA152]|nr:hypothetical protein [Streptomyces sp. CBMA152]
MHLGDAQVLGDPALCHVAEEPHVEDLLLPGRQSAQPRLDRLAVDDDVERRIGRAQRVAEAEPVLCARQFGVQGKRGVAVEGFEAGLDLVLGHPGVRGELGDRRAVAADGLGELLAGGADPAAQVLHPARHVQGPHVVAEVPFELTGDGRHGEALERGPALRVVAVDGLHQAERRDLAQVLDGLAPVAEPTGQPLGHRQPGPDQLLPQCLAFGPVGQGDEAGEGGRGVGGVVVRVLRCGVCVSTHAEQSLERWNRMVVTVGRPEPGVRPGLGHVRSGQPLPRTCLRSEAR